MRGRVLARVKVGAKVVAGDASLRFRFQHKATGQLRASIDELFDVPGRAAANASEGGMTAGALMGEPESLYGQTLRFGFHIASYIARYKVSL